jgi:hypothetical protein
MKILVPIKFWGLTILAFLSLCACKKNPPPAPTNPPDYQIKYSGGMFEGDTIQFHSNVPQGKKYCGFLEMAKPLPRYRLNMFFANRGATG